MVIVSFGGGLYLALRGETINGSGNSTTFDPVDDTSLGKNPDETRLDFTSYSTMHDVCADTSYVSMCSFKKKHMSERQYYYFTGRYTMYGGLVFES